MIGFTLIYSDSVRKTLKKLPKDRQIEIVKKLDLLPINPMLLDIVKMKGYENTYMIRIGKYRVTIVVDFAKRLIEVVKLDVRGRIGY
jgi:mRNA-degrading endonuclease RelE of RelBE toxin-antitoxin system